MLDMHVVAFFLFFHFVFDFWLQPRIMARKKSTDTKWLLGHVALYASGLAVAMYFPLRDIYSFTFWNAIIVSLVFASINGTTHFAIDAVTSRISKYWYVKAQPNAWIEGCSVPRNVWEGSIACNEYDKNMEAFWTTIGIDQLLHTLILLGTLVPLSR